MGWNGAELFDRAVDVALEHAPKVNTDEGVRVTDKTYHSIVAGMYSAFNDSDWDTEEESKHFLPHLASVMHDMGLIDDEDYEDLTEGGDED